MPTTPSLVITNPDAIAPGKMVRFGSVKIGQLIKVVRDGVPMGFERIETSQFNPRTGIRTVQTVTGAFVREDIETNVEMLAI